MVSLIFSNRIDLTGSLPIQRHNSSVRPLEHARTFWSWWSKSSGSIFRIFLGGTTFEPNSLEFFFKCYTTETSIYLHKILKNTERKTSRLNGSKSKPESLKHDINSWHNCLCNFIFYCFLHGFLKVKISR